MIATAPPGVGTAPLLISNARTRMVVGILTRQRLTRLPGPFLNLLNIAW